MRNVFKYSVLLFLLFTCTTSYSQENTFTVGFQYKPIFPSTFFSTGTKTISQNEINFSISQKMGYCAGMIIRRGITKQLSVETGINYTKRNFSLSITDTTFTGNSSFTIIGYEIPLQGMIFLRIADKLYMNTAFGAALDMYPSNIATDDAYFQHLSKRHGVFQSSALANLGFEYRTTKKGYFYAGASYHLPFSYFYLSSIKYMPRQEIVRTKLRGNYLTIDFRYYFHEDPLKPKKKKKKAEKQ